MCCDGNLVFVPVFPECPPFFPHIVFSVVMGGMLEG